MSLEPRVTSSSAAFSLTPSTPAAKPAAAESPAQPFSRVLNALGEQLSASEKLVDAAVRGPNTSDPGALIALQAGIYRHNELVELTAKLIDKATDAVRTTLRGNG